MHSSLGVMYSSDTWEELDLNPCHWFFGKWTQDRASMESSSEEPIFQETINMHLCACCNSWPSGQSRTRKGGSEREKVCPQSEPRVHIKQAKQHVEVNIQIPNPHLSHEGMAPASVMKWEPSEMYLFVGKGNFYPISSNGSFCRSLARLYRCA